MARKRPPVWILLVGGVGGGMWLAVVTWMSPHSWLARAFFFGLILLSATLTGAWAMSFGGGVGPGRALWRGGLVGVLIVTLASLQVLRLLDWPLVAAVAAAFVLGELALVLPRRA